MPLMTSPIDGSPMREVERFGVKIDICQTSGGIWLDRGELEKIIMTIREEALVDGGFSAKQAYDDVHYHEQSRRKHHETPKRSKRNGLFENLLDIFD